MMPAIAGQPEVLNLLVKYKESLNETNNSGATPLILATLNGLSENS
jgi:ankyrin repeat protein